MDSRDAKPQNLQELGQALREEWLQLGDDTLHNLAYSIPSRMTTLRLLVDITLVSNGLLILCNIFKL